MRCSKPVLVLPAFVLIWIFLVNDTAVPKRPPMFDYFKSGVTTGYETYNLLLCTPEFSERPRQLSLSRDYISDEFSTQDPNPQFHLIPVPDTFAIRYFKDMPGDTVMVLWPGGKFKAVIDDIVYYKDMCYSGFECVLKPITEIENRPKRFEFFITLRKEKFYDGPVIPYTEYQLDDPSYLAIVDSLKLEMIRARMYEDSIAFVHSLARMPEDRKEQSIADRKKRIADENYPFYDILFNLYGIVSEEVPDTLYLMAVGATGGESSWVAQLELSRYNGGWKARTMSEPVRGSYGNEIKFSFDLNHDGILEYFINGSIHILYNGAFVWALGGPYRGC